MLIYFAGLSTSKLAEYILFGSGKSKSRKLMQFPTLKTSFTKNVLHRIIKSDFISLRTRMVKSHLVVIFVISFNYYYKETHISKGGSML